MDDDADPVTAFDKTDLGQRAIVRRANQHDQSFLIGAVSKDRVAIGVPDVVIRHAMPMGARSDHWFTHCLRLQGNLHENHPQVTLWQVLVPCH